MTMLNGNIFKQAKELLLSGRDAKKRSPGRSGNN